MKAFLFSLFLLNGFVAQAEYGNPQYQMFRQQAEERRQYGQAFQDLLRQQAQGRHWSGPATVDQLRFEAAQRSEMQREYTNMLRGQAQAKQAWSQGGGSWSGEVGSGWGYYPSQTFTRVAPQIQVRQFDSFMELPDRANGDFPGEIIRQQPVEVIHPSRLIVDFPPNSQATQDGNPIPLSNNRWDVAFYDYERKARTFKFHVIISEDGYTLSGDYHVEALYGVKTHKKLTRENMDSQDDYLKGLLARKEAKIASLRVWHKKFGDYLIGRQTEINAWKASLLKSVEGELPSIREKVLPLIDSAYADGLKKLDEVNALLAAEVGEREALYSKGGSDAEELRKKGSSSKETEESWVKTIHLAETQIFNEKSQALLKAELDKRTTFSVAPVIDREKKIITYIGRTLKPWLKNSTQNIETWKADRLAAMVTGPRSDLERWHREEEGFIKSVPNEAVRAELAKAHVEEKTRRESLLRQREAEIVEESKARAKPHHEVFDLFAAQFKKDLNVSSALTIQAAINEKEAQRMREVQAELDRGVQMEISLRKAYVPASARIEREEKIEKYAATARSETSKAIQAAKDWASNLRGQRSAQLEAWEKEQRAEIDSIRYRPVKATVLAALEKEIALRSSYEKNREVPISALALKREDAANLFQKSAIEEFRKNVDDKISLAAHKESLNALEKERTELEFNLQKQDAIELDRRAPFGSVLTLAKQQEVLYPLALKLPASCKAFWLGFELTEKFGLYANGRLRPALREFAPAEITDLECSAGHLAVITDGGKLLTVYSADDALGTQKPDLEDAVFERVWPDGKGGFFVNLVKGEERFTLQMDGKAESLDIVDTLKAPERPKDLFKRIAE